MVQGEMGFHLKHLKALVDLLAKVGQYLCVCVYVCREREREREREHKSGCECVFCG